VVSILSVSKPAIEAFAPAPDDFTPRSPASFDELSGYQFNSKTDTSFYKTGGVHMCWSEMYEYEGAVVDYGGIGSVVSVGQNGRRRSQP
jgi:hypothetical protein